MTEVLAVSTSRTERWQKWRICRQHCVREGKVCESTSHQNLKKSMRELTTRDILHCKYSFLLQNQIRHIDDIVRADWKIRHRIQTFHFLPRFTFRGGNGLFYRPVVLIRDIGDNPFSII